MADNEAPQQKVWPIVGSTPRDIDDNEAPHQKARPTVSHFSYAPPFEGPNFLTKMLESNITMLIYLLTFYLFDDIEKISKALMRIILHRQKQF